MKVNLERSFAILNGNIRRIASRSARRQIGENEPVVAADPGGTVADDLAIATLMPTPRSLHELWQEYQHGVGGRKAARLFSHAERGRAKHRYHRRKIVWDLVAGLTRKGQSADHAIEKNLCHLWRPDFRY
ncbi:hypothetical protein MHU86_7476 [Fragilaria crotonensis]|nr:hypothetical protein MHU86_7476 [Fragilaria crotonensis]